MKSLLPVSAALLSVFTMAGAQAQQVCNANLIATAPDSAFELHGNGTATHKASGLMWSVCLAGQSYTAGACDGNAAEHDWEQAHVIADSTSFAGYEDWRLPNVNELVSILELKCEAPALNTSIFPGTASALMLWSNTPSAADGVAHAVVVVAGLPEALSMTEAMPFLLVRENKSE